MRANYMIQNEFSKQVVVCKILGFSSIQLTLSTAVFYIEFHFLLIPNPISAKVHGLT